MWSGSSVVLEVNFRGACVSESAEFNSNLVEGKEVKINVPFLSLQVTAWMDQKREYQ